MRTWRAIQRLDADRPWLLDGILALGLLLAVTVAISFSGRAEISLTQVALLLIAVGPFAARRILPLTVLLVSGTAVFALLLLGYGTPVVGSALFLAAYSVAAQRSLQITAVAAGFCAALICLVAALPGRMSWPEALTNVALFVGMFALGRASQSQRRTSMLLAERAELAEQAKAEASRNAVNQERLRIARELHDVVGHSLGAIALQAGVGARVATDEPEAARAALLAIAERSRSSLQEVRQLLGALRNPEDDTAPNPTLDDVDELLAQAARAGVRVEVIREGEPWPLSPALGLTCYRVLQESLTNVMRHSGTDRASVRLEYRPDQLVLSVSDSGRGAQPSAGAGGGQVGMHERVAMWGGRLETGNLPGGGYRVRAEIPRPEEGRQ